MGALGATVTPPHDSDSSCSSLGSAPISGTGASLNLSSAGIGGAPRGAPWGGRVWMSPAATEEMRE
jgi:hypothetical protein